MKLKESKQLDEKTYTVGNTQYWRRNGKCYSWTATGGRKECSEDEYMRAISGSTSGGSVQHTEPHEDQARQSSEPNQVVANALGSYLPSDQFKRLSSEEKNACLDFAYKGVNVDKLSQRSKDIMIKGYDSFIKDRQRYANQAKRGQAPTPHSSDVDYWNTQISDANRMKDLLSPADNAVVSTPEKDPNLGKTVKLKSGRTGTIKTMDDLSVEEKREGTFGTVTIQGVKYDVYDSLWSNGFASLVRHEEESNKTTRTPSQEDMIQDIFKSTSISSDEELASELEDRINSGEESVGHDYSLDIYKITGVEHFIHNGKPRVRFTAKVYGIDYKTGKHFEMDTAISTTRTRSDPTFSKSDLENAVSSSSATKDRALLKVDGEEYYKIGDNKWEYHPSNSHAMPKIYTTDQMLDIANKGKYVKLDKGSKPEPKKEEPIPKPEEPKKEERPSWDDTESDYISYKDVKRFDHTSWDIDGYETTIVKRPEGGYYLQNEDYDEEFETKGDLVRYLQDMEADYIGQDSENDY